MSLSALRSFSASVSADEQLRDKLHAAAGVDDVLTIAAAHGHSLDKAVLLREQGKALASAEEHQLSSINSWGDALLHAFGSSEEAVDKA
jgi:predicted ribosomally synthesized peptide with nif11-like leader